MATMRAVLLTTTGPASSLEYTATHPKPSPSPNHVLIRVHAFGVNRPDILARKGEDGSKAKLPRVLGVECVGVVEDDGGIEGIKVGSVVVALLGGLGRELDGTYSEYCLAPAKCVASIRVQSPAPGQPIDPATWARLAAIPLTFLTAFGALDTVQLKRNDRLLVRGGASAIGMAITCVAKSVGATVAVTTRDPTKAPSLSENGADFVILEREGGIADDVKMMFSQRDATIEPMSAGADKVIDLIGPTTLRDSLVSCRSPGGYVCTAGTLAATPNSTNPGINPLVDIPSGTYLTHFDARTVDLNKVPMQEIVDRALDGRYRINLDKVFALEEIVKAHEYMEAKKAMGKVVVVVPDL
ncbi:hypothetical protein HK104_011142 [Borealophlyctis nickersoniae]|nr:hypothetical protein HK104_011142 [Borealophlyctis nickersoniae]